MTPIATNTVETIPAGFPMPLKAAVWIEGGLPGLILKLVRKLAR